MFLLEAEDSFYHPPPGINVKFQVLNGSLTRFGHLRFHLVFTLAEGVLGLEVVVFVETEVFQSIVMLDQMNSLNDA